MNKVKKVLSVLMLVILAVSTYVVPVSAEEIITVNVTGTYGQTEARAMLQEVNSFRTGEGVDYWNKDNATKTEFNKPGKTTLQALTYDYNLEKIAMQRAMEIALMFSHTRPNGSDCFTLMNEYGTKGENIAAGSGTYQGAFTQWREEDDLYAGQGHRRNMLNANFKSIGIGHVKYMGVHYWVQEFGGQVITSEETPVEDAAKDVEVEVAKKMMAAGPEFEVEPESYQLFIGDVMDVPSVTMRFSMSNVWPENSMSSSDVSTEDWTAVDPAVVTIENGRITANKVGSTTIEANIEGKTVSAKVEVENIACEHEWGTGTIKTPATCTQEGVRTYTCSKCQETKTETIPTVEHTPQTIPAVKATCVNEGSTEGSICSVCKQQLRAPEVTPALGHQYEAPTFTWASDYKSVEAVFTCSACKAVQKVEANITSQVSGNKTTFVAMVSLNGQDYKDTKTVTSEGDDNTSKEPGDSEGDDNTSKEPGDTEGDDNTPITSEGDSELRIVSEIGIKEITQELQDAGFATPAAVESAMLQSILTKAGYGNDNQSYDVQLQVYDANNETWTAASVENFPKDGLTVLLPYPNGTTKDGYRFTVAHMFTHNMNGYKAGEIELPEVTKTDEGLQFTVKGLSPVMVAWQQIETEESDGNNSGTKPADTNQKTDNVQKSPKTGDEINAILLMSYMTVCAVVAGGAVTSKKRSIKKN